MRALLMLATFALAGLNLWLIMTHQGDALNYIATFVCLGSGFHTMASLVRYP
jgi:hypothetical protein